MNLNTATTTAIFGISRTTKFMLALMIAVAAATAALALFKPAASASPTSISARYGTDSRALNQEAMKDQWIDRRNGSAVPEFSLTQDRIAEHQYLAQLAANAARIQTQELVKEQWIDRRAATTASFSLVQDRIMEHRFLAERAATAAAVQNHELAKEQWVDRRIGVSTDLVGAAQHQEELKDRWLDSHQ